jgi:outer membrane protein
MNTLVTTSIAALVAAAALAAPALAQSAGDMTLGFGVGYVEPKDDNGTLAGADADVDGNGRPIVTFEYFIKDNIGIEVLGAVPFEHDISLNGTGIGSTKQLPPTVSLNYHIPTGGKFTPFVGVGVNYTKFFDEESSLGDLQIDDSWGFAATLGVDYAMSEKGSARIDVRYMNISSDVTLDRVDIGEVEVDPVVVNVSYVMKF